MALHQKWAKVQLPQQAHLELQKITAALYGSGHNSFTTFRVLGWYREREVRKDGRTGVHTHIGMDSPH